MDARPGSIPLQLMSAELDVSLEAAEAIAGSHREWRGADDALRDGPYADTRAFRVHRVTNCWHFADTPPVLADFVFSSRNKNPAFAGLSRGRYWA
jgi:hypothetical protein